MAEEYRGEQLAGRRPGLQLPIGREARPFSVSMRGKTFLKPSGPSAALRFAKNADTDLTSWSFSLLVMVNLSSGILITRTPIIDPLGAEEVELGGV